MTGHQISESMQLVSIRACSCCFLWWDCARREAQWVPAVLCHGAPVSSGSSTRDCMRCRRPGIDPSPLAIGVLSGPDLG